MSATYKIDQIVTIRLKGDLEPDTAKQIVRARVVAGCESRGLIVEVGRREHLIWGGAQLRCHQHFRICQ